MTDVEGFFVPLAMTNSFAGCPLVIIEFLRWPEGHHSDLPDGAQDMETGCMEMVMDWVPFLA